MVTFSLVETEDATVQRLAAKARDGRYYASSTSTPGQLHYLTGLSCDCLGFQAHQQCKHHAALLVALGWIGREPESIAELPPVCAQCGDTGTVAKNRSRWIGGGTNGYRSTWTVTEPCDACTPDTAA